MDNDSAEKTLHDGLIKFGKMITKASIIIEGTVYSVDEIKYTCVVTVATVNSDGSNTNTNVLNVPLKVLRGSQASFIEIPKVGSDCTLCYRDNNIGRPQLYQVNECSKIIMKISNSIFYCNSTGFKLNNNTKGLKKTLKDIVNILINFKTISPGGNGVTDPTVVTNLNTYLTDLNDYLLD